MSPCCACVKDNDNDLHSFQHCPLYDSLHSDLFSQLVGVPGSSSTGMNTRELGDLLMYGGPTLNLISKTIIIEATIAFIKRSRRFNSNSC